jgi:predicted RNA binding protein YcfA (HicA-like mRNA interferase family)
MDARATTRLARDLGHPEKSDRIVVAGKGSATVHAGTLASIRPSGIEELR